MILGDGKFVSCIMATSFSKAVATAESFLKAKLVCNSQTHLNELNEDASSLQTFRNLWI